MKLLFSCGVEPYQCKAEPMYCCKDLVGITATYFKSGEM